MSRTYDSGPMEATAMRDVTPVIAPLVEPVMDTQEDSLPPSGGNDPSEGTPVVKHPAKYSPEILAELARLLDAFNVTGKVLDPFAGVGGIHQLRTSKREAWAIELEPEWAQQSALLGPTVCADFFDIEFPEKYAAVVTSPCPHPDMRVLTADLRWVRAGDLVVGDQLLAFDEMSPFVKANGQRARRKFRWAEVTRSEPNRKDSCRVILSNGTEVRCSWDHPWLGHRSPSRDTQEWIKTSDLTPGVTQVLLQVEPWAEERSYEAGWLAGMFDGEGSVAYGVHGTPKMSMCQVLGSIQDTIEQRLKLLDIPFNTIPRTTIEGRQPMMNTYVTDGWPGMLSALGRLRPTRLLDKFMAGDVSSRSIQAERVTVVAVEPMGPQLIQELTTTTGTFICEGYLHHNTYGNRMADTYDGRDGSKRMTYTTALGRPLTDNNSGGLQWGVAYREFHIEAWHRVFNEVVADGGHFLLNVKDHIRDGHKQPVVKWHKAICKHIGFRFVADISVGVRGMGFGANGKARVKNEHILVFVKKP